MDFEEALERLNDTGNETGNKAFAEFFSSLVESNGLVYTAAKPAGRELAIDTVTHAGNVFCVMYSEKNKAIALNNSRVCRIGLSNLIDCCYSTPHIAGIAINPDSDKPVFILRKDLQVISGKPDPRLQSRDWGPGIPDYNESDVMTAEEAFDFAMEIVAKYGLEEGRFKVLETSSALTEFPNFVCRKDDSLFFIMVGVAVAPHIPFIKPEIVPELLKIAKKDDAKVLYAPVSIGSSDPERMKAGIVLCGDAFISNFTGFIALN